MAHDTDNAAESAPRTSEEVSAPTDASEQPAPPLNRAERRAQARGKKSGAGVSNPSVPQAAHLRGPGGHGSGVAGQTRFPRTGHK